MQTKINGITLSNDHELKFIVASGALGFDGRGWSWEAPLHWVNLLQPNLFTVVLKTITQNPRAGNGQGVGLVKTVRVLRHGTVNAVGMRNPGINGWLAKHAPKIPSDLPVVISIFGSNQELENMATVIKQEMADGKLSSKKIVGIEINISCPNVQECGLPTDLVATCRKVKELTCLPLLIKLGYDPQKNYLLTATSLSGIAEAVQINSVPWRYAFPSRTSPLDHFGGGGVSGKIVQHLTWQMASELSQIMPTVWPSIWSYQDIAKAEKQGAKAVTFGSIFLLRPWAPTLYVRRYNQQSV
ncbi:MAG: hypothetical protein WC310_00240 [Patescibacteria group bacterium]|jgi:dihydroorotate dehydrogenase